MKLPFNLKSAVLPLPLFVGSASLTALVQDDGVIPPSKRLVIAREHTRAEKEHSPTRRPKLPM